MVQLEEENQPSVCQSPGNQSSDINGNSFSKQKHAKVMENCIAFFLNVAATTKSLTTKQKALIEQRLVDSFPFYHQPDHIPYAAMIEVAIEKLDEKGGSSEEAISHFIRNEYLDLPWAHDTFVKHHLEKLCKVGVLKTRDGLYMTADKVSSDAYPLSPSSTFGIDSDYHYSPSAISNTDSDLSVFQIPAQKRMSHRKRKLLRTKRGRKELKRQRKEVVAGEGMIIETNTSRVKQKGEENKKKNVRVREYDKVDEKVNRFRGKRRKIKELTGLKETSSHFVEETNHLQGHDAMPVKVQCYSRQKKGQLPRKSSKGQKIRLKPACIPGRCRGSQRKMDLLVNELNEDQKLFEVLNAMKQKILNKKKSVENCQRDLSVEVTQLHTPQIGQAEETEMFLDSGIYEPIVVGKTKEGDDQTFISSLRRKGRKVHPKSTRKPGRSRGQPCITDLPVVVTQLNPEVKKAKGLDTITKGRREATETQRRIRIDLNIGVERDADNTKEKQHHRQAGKAKMVMEFREGQILETRALETMQKLTNVHVNIVKCDEKREQEKHIDDKDQSLAHLADLVQSVCNLLKLTD